MSHQLSRFWLNFFAIMICAGMLFSPARAQVPTDYQDLYNLLNSDLAAFNTTIGTPVPYPTIGAAALMHADANNGPQLINSGSFFGLQLELQTIKAMGIQGVEVSVGFPMLYAPFFSSPADYQNYPTFYANVASAVRAAGLKLIVENNVLLDSSQTGQTVWNTSAFYAGLTWDQYIQARAQTAAVIAQTMAPDYLVLAEEPTTEAVATGQSNILTPSDEATMVSQMITSVQATGLSAVQLGAGVGTWESNYQSFVQGLVALPLNFIDMHIYPINQSNPANALTIASMAAAAGLPVTMSECWLHKVRDTELGVLSNLQIRARDPFSFWPSLDTYFLQTILNLANYTQMRFVTAFGTSYLSAYLGYNSTSSLTPQEILTQEGTAAGDANSLGTFSPTGISLHNAIVTPPDTVAPSTPTGLTPMPQSSKVHWTPLGPKTQRVPATAHCGIEHKVAEHADAPQLRPF